MTRRQSIAQILLAPQFAAAQTTPPDAAASSNQFGLKLAVELAAAHPDKNVFISPLSIFLALAMTGNGAAGKSKAAIWSTLALRPNVTDDQLNASIAALTKLLDSQKGVQLSIANALWASLAFQFSKDYAARCEAAFQAKVTTLDFAKPDAAPTINKWVSEKTGGKIPEIVSASGVRNAAVILTNAIYFRGKWDNPFEKSQTQAKSFHLAAGHVKEVPMMRNRYLHLAYRATATCESAELQYQNASIAMQVLLPKAGHTSASVLRTLDWQALRKQPTTADLDLSLPRFTLDFSDTLARPLKKMGMEIAFKNPPADFTPMGSKDFFIGDVIHKTRLEVDEEGTIAAAATAVMMVGAAAPMKREKKTLVFDKPFVVLLYETTTGALLFAGLVQEPK